MILYRISQEKYCTDLSGEGARLYGGRWNREGTAVLYTASNSSLAMLEKLVHLQPSLFPEDLKMVHLEVPENVSLITVKKKELTTNWRDESLTYHLHNLGEQFIKEGKALGLIVPSVINDIDTNVILNVRHPDYSKIKIIKTTKVLFDKRLLQ